jgi:TonB family protein
LLIAKGADINAKTNFDATPLDMAMANGGKEIAEWLRQHGASAGSGVLLDIPPVHKPTLLSQPLPRYTEKARNANIGGTVVLQAVIRKDGSITDVKVLKGLGYGLDESVINTITGKWRFNPATLNGNPVDVGANITTSFHPF